MRIFQDSVKRTPLKVPAAPAESGCVAVFPPWRVALKRRCTGLKESTQKADAFSVLRRDYTLCSLKIYTKGL